ncbi:MAG: RNA polymerase sigma factor SigJ [Acidobacteria bacterium]|nr:RNA polymerase sigma factor SigJ [Acidobacteriota bacterium]
MTTAEDFQRERPYLVRLAYRMLGSVADAEDVVQQSFLRWLSAGCPALDSPRAWFTRTCVRLCLDRLKSARHEREQYVGEWLPEPILDREERGPEVDETLSMALLLTIQRLRPAERAAFLLHDVFDYEFKEVAEILDLEPAYCRQLAVRARRHLEGEAVRSEEDAETVHRLSKTFFEALASGDLGALQSLLAEGVVLRADGGGRVAAARRPLFGRPKVLRFLEGVFVKPRPRPRLELRASWFNGAPGFLVCDDGRPVSAFHFRILDGLIQDIFIQRNPEKLQVFEAVEASEERRMGPSP